MAPDWLCDFLTSDAFYVLLGAAIAYGATHLQDWQKARAVRRGLGAILHGELVTMSPSDDPVYHDPVQAKRVALRSIPLLLAPGILDPDRDMYLIMELIFLASVVDSFNERARLYDEAYVKDEPREKMQLLYNALQMSNWDYQRAHRNVLESLWQLGPPMPLYNTYRYRPRTLRDKFDFWRSKRTRHAWIDLNNANAMPPTPSGGTQSPPAPAPKTPPADGPEPVTESESEAS